MYKKPYNTRNSGRYNTPGQFVPASEVQYQSNPANTLQQQQQQHDEFEQKLQHQIMENLHQIPLQDNDVDMKQDPTLPDGSSKNEARPAWMKSKIPGVKKISNKERRKRQNAALRRLLTPKNALMVLNEMKPHDQIANQFKVEVAPNNQNYYNKNAHTFCADLNLEGAVYKGYGENKLSARNAAAEQAIRDLIIKKMMKVVNGEGPSDDGDDEALPMIQLASFALHKLFTEWEYEGHKVPQLRPQTTSISEGSVAGASEAGASAAAGAATGAGAAAGAVGGASGRLGRALPVNASAMHPCMLLTYMRPHVQYRELSNTNDRVNAITFDIAVDVDDNTYIGTGTSKKEARKEAARAACHALFGVTFDATVTSNRPIPA